MKSGYKLASLLIWFTQLGLSVASPLVVFILGAVWLRERFGIGLWIVIVGTALGILGAVGGLISSLKTLDRLGRSDKEKDKPISFNDHD